MLARKHSIGRLLTRKQNIGRIVAGKHNIAKTPWKKTQHRRKRYKQTTIWWCMGNPLCFQYESSLTVEIKVLDPGFLRLSTWKSRLKDEDARTGDPWTKEMAVGRSTDKARRWWEEARTVPVCQRKASGKPNLRTHSLQQRDYQLCQSHACWKLHKIPAQSQQHLSEVEQDSSTLRLRLLLSLVHLSGPHSSRSARLPSSSFFWTDAEVAASKFFPRRKRFYSFAAQHWS